MDERYTYIRMPIDAEGNGPVPDSEANCFVHEIWDEEHICVATCPNEETARRLVAALTPPPPAVDVFQRYKLCPVWESGTWGRSYMQENPAGEWVRWDDAGSALAAERVRVEKAEAALKHYAETYCEGWCKEAGGFFDDCGGCKARLALARAEKAEAALRPFADAAASLSDRWLDHETHWYQEGRQITVGELRAARATLSTEGGERP